MSESIQALVWGENVHEQTSDVVRRLYPDGLHGAIAASLNACDGIDAGVATLQQPEHGLPRERLEQTDVLLWWGHAAHDEVRDDVVERVQQRVWEGMGLIVLHSGHFSKIFRRLMGTPCALTWREAGERERLWAVNPSHPIAAGIDRHFELTQSEMYGEPFGIPEPAETVFLSWFEGGEVFRSGVTWRRGAGHVFYFGPGHETYPIYHDASVQRILANAVRWANHRADRWHDADEAPNRPVDEALEPLEQKGPRLHADGEAGLR